MNKTHRNAKTAYMQHQKLWIKTSLTSKINVSLQLNQSNSKKCNIPSQVCAACIRKTQNINVNQETRNRTPCSCLDCIRKKRKKAQKIGDWLKNTRAHTHHPHLTPVRTNQGPKFHNLDPMPYTLPYPTWLQLTWKNVHLPRACAPERATISRSLKPMR